MEKQTNRAPESDGPLVLDEELERIELRLLTGAMFERYGFDCRDYAFASLRHRVWNAVLAEGLKTIAGLQERILHDPPAMARLLKQLSIVGGMFRDSQFFFALREQVIPHLLSHPFVRIWHAGCGAGEDVYSLAILLSEAGIYDRCRIYATDANEVALKQARDGSYPLSSIDVSAARYAQSGGRCAFAEYVETRGGEIVLHPRLRKQVLFSQHDLLTDASFNEFHLILCRDVMIYFNARAAARTHRLMYGSLRRFGFLGLGCRESLLGTPHELDYQVVDGEQKLFRRSE